VGGGGRHPRGGDDHQHPGYGGVWLPWEFGRRLRDLMSRVPNIHRVVVSCHCHNDLGWRWQLPGGDSSRRAAGGMPRSTVSVSGPASLLEELVMCLRTRKDLLSYELGIRTEEIYRTSRLLQSITGFERATQQSHRGRQRLPATSGYPSAWGLQTPTDVRDHDSGVVGCFEESAGPRQAFGAATPSRRPGRTGRRARRG